MGHNDGNVGRVWIAGRPDWTKARKQTQDQLEARLKGMVVQLPGEIEFPTKAQLQDEKERLEAALSPLRAQVKAVLDEDSARDARRHILEILYGIKTAVETELDTSSVRETKAQMERALGEFDSNVWAKANRKSAQFASKEMQASVKDIETVIEARADLLSARRESEAIDRAAGSKKVELFADPQIAQAKRAAASLKAAVADGFAVHLKPQVDINAFLAAKASITRLVSPVWVELKPKGSAVSAVKEAAELGDGDVPFTFRPVFADGSLASLKSMWEKHAPGNPMWVWPRMDWGNLRAMKADVSRRFAELGSTATKALKAATVLDDILPKNGFHNDFLRSINAIRAAGGKTAVTFKDVARSMQDGRSASERLGAAWSSLRESISDTHKSLKRFSSFSFPYKNEAVVNGLSTSIRGLNKDLGDGRTRLDSFHEAGTSAFKGIYKAYQQSGLQTFMRWKIQVKTEEAIKQVKKFADYAKKTLSGSFVVGGGALLGTSIMKAIGNIGIALKQMAPALNAAAGGFAALGAAGVVFRVAFNDIKVTLKDLEQDVWGMHNAIQEAFWGDGVKGHIVGLTRALLDGLKPALLELTGVLSNVFVKAANALANSEDKIRSIIESSTEGFKPLEDAGANATTALMRMLAAGAQFFPQFTAWLADLSRKWLEWTEKTDLVAWTQGGIDAVGAFGKVVKNLFGIMKDFLGMSTAGTASMAEFGDRLEQLRAKINTPDLRAGFEAFFSHANSGLSAVRDAIGDMILRIGRFGDSFGGIVEKVGVGFGKILDIITDTIGNNKALDGIGNLIGGFNTLLDAVKPAIVMFGTHLFSALGTVGTVVQNLEGPLKTIGIHFAKLAGFTFDAIARVAEAVLPSLANTLAGFMPHLTRLADAVLPVVGDWLGRIVSVGAQVMAAMLTPIIDWLADAMPQLEELGNAILNPILDIVSALAEPVGNLARALLPVLMSVLEGVAGSAGTMLGVWAEIATRVGPTLVNVLATIVEWLSPVLEWLGKTGGEFAAWAVIGTGVAKTVGKVVDFLRPMVTVLKSVFGWVSKFLGPLGRFAPLLGGIGVAVVGVYLAVTNWDAFKEKVSAAWDWLSEFFKGLPDKLSRWFFGYDEMVPTDGGISAGGYVQHVDGLKDKLARAFEDIKAAIPGWIENIAKWFRDWWPVAKQKLGEFVDWCGEKLGEFFEYLEENLPGWVEAAWNWLTETGFPWMLDTLGEFAEFAGEKLGELWEWCKEHLPGWFSAAWDWLWGTGIPWVLDKLGEFAGWAGEKLGELWEYLKKNLPGWVSAAWDWLWDTGIPWIIDKLGEGLTWLGDKIAEFFSWVWESLPGWFHDIKEGLKTKAREAFQWFADGISEKWEDVKEWFSGLWTRIKNAITGSGDSKDQLSGEGSGVLEGFWDGVKEKWRSVCDWFSGLWTRIKNAILGKGEGGSGGGGDAKKQLPEEGKAVLTGFHDDGVLAKWKSVSEWFSGLWERIKGLLPDPFGVLKEKGEQVVGGFGEKARAGWETVKNGIGNWWDEIRGKLPNPSGQLQDKGNDMVAGFQTGTNVPYQSLQNMFSGMAGRLRDLMGNTNSTLQGQGSQLIGGFKSGVDSMMHAVNNVFSNMAWSIQNLTRGLSSNLLSGAGHSIMMGLYNGIVNAWNRYIVGTVSNMANWIRDHKGPLSYDRKLLEPAGEAIMKGLYEGLSGGFENVMRLVDGMADQMADAVTSTIDVPISATVDTSAYSPSGAMGVAIASGTPNTGGSVYNVSMNLDGRDLRDLRDIAQFTDMMKIRGRMMAGSGM